MDYSAWVLKTETPHNYYINHIFETDLPHNYYINHISRKVIFYQTDNFSTDC